MESGGGAGGDSKLNCEIGGTGSRVAILHPVGLDLTFLAAVATVLRNEFTVLSVDQRGGAPYERRC
jgi:hypothetical protein